MKLLDKLKSKLERTPEPWPEGLPRPYEQGRIIPLQKFINGPELVARLEKNREARRRWALELFGEKGEKEIWDRDW